MLDFCAQNTKSYLSGTQDRQCLSRDQIHRTAKFLEFFSFRLSGSEEDAALPHNKATEAKLGNDFSFVQSLLRPQIIDATMCYSSCNSSISWSSCVYENPPIPLKKSRMHFVEASICLFQNRMNHTNKLKQSILAVVIP